MLKGMSLAFIYGFVCVNDSWVEAKIRDVIGSLRIKVVMVVLVGHVECQIKNCDR